MWLRKRLRNRRLLEPYWDWRGRRLAWRLSPASLDSGESGHQFLLIDLREGCDVVDSLPAPELAGAAWETDGAEAPWEQELAVPDDPASGLAEEGMTPALRRELTRRLEESREAAAGLLEELAMPRCDTFFIRNGEALVWRPFGMEEEAAAMFDDSLDAAAELAAMRLSPHLERVAGREESKAQKSQRKRLSRARKSMAAEEKRLEAMREEREMAQLLKAAMHALPRREKLAEVTVDGPEGPVTIPLDPSRTVAENMDRLFRRAAKGDRGISMLHARQVELSRQEELLQAGRLPAPARQSQRKQDKAAGQSKLQGIARFRTDDGFLVLRGKNARANHSLATRHASPFDYWFHAEGGPGAHVVLKRDHAAQEVPQQSMEQAAVLAGLKSWQEGSDKARVMCALGKHVSPVKGGSPGQVTVEQVERSLLVELDGDLENRLAID